MSLFSKNHMTSEVDALEFENNSHSSSSSVSKFGFNRSHNNKPRYGIDKAISLVRSLQKHKINSTVIAGIMKQTLESVDIHFEDIISDAQRKESDIHQESEHKDKEIEAMKRKFEAMKDEKLKLQQDLDETVSVREFLQQAVSSQAEKSSQQKSNSSQTDQAPPEFINDKEAIVS